MPQPTSKARLVLTALFVDHQTPTEVAARYGVHRAWVYKLKARYEGLDTPVYALAESFHRL